MNTAAEPRLAPQSALLANCLARNDASGKFDNFHTQTNDVSQIFEKKFCYQNNPEWQLPSPDDLFREFYQFDSLQQLKQSLNSVKCKLNDYNLEEWSAHTRRKDPAGEIPWRLKNETQAEFVTVAWCKFFECLHKFPLVRGPKVNSLHLCEAPGAFIAAMNHYLHSTYDKEEIQWNWLSTTLNPYYEGNPLNKMILDDRFMLHTLDHWLFHDDFTGNIISPTNLEHMQRQCEERLKDGVHLITADGSIDCVEAPDCQEEFVSMLHFAEITSALSILADGGSYIMKFFTLFDATTVSTMYLLNCAFDEVHVFKPATSKRGNSEIYVICLGYKKNTKHLRETLERMKDHMIEDTNTLPMFVKAHLPKDFLLKHEICARLFMNLQTSAIEDNIFAYEFKTKNHNRRSHLLRSAVCNEFFQRYKIKPIAAENTILHGQQGKICHLPQTPIYKGSHTEREMLKGLTTEEHIFRLRCSAHEIERLIGDGDNDGTLMTKTVDANITPNFYRGRPYEALRSSLFVLVHTLLLRLKLLATFDCDPLWLETPKCILDTGEEIVLDPQLSDSFMVVQQKFFVTILDAIITHKPSRLSFHNMAFLTHYSVSILRYLSLKIFPSLKITTEPQYAVELERPETLNYNENSLHELINLRDALDRDINIVCVLDISELHGNKFCAALTKYNNMLLLRNFNALIDK